MSLGNVLNVAIGLMFTFLILGLLGTTVHEAAASLSRSRGRLLRAGLMQLLGDGSPNGALFEKVFGHAVVQSLSSKGLPAYVPANSFSLALFDSLGDGSGATRFTQIERSVQALPNGRTRQSLMAFIVEAEGDLEALRVRVETWFDDAMDRLTGIYKRRSQAIHLLFGFAVAVGFNVDSIHIAQVLWQDAGKRQAIVTMAQNYTTVNSTLPAAGSVDQMVSQLDSLPIPMGWDSWQAPGRLVLWLYPLIGWLITGFAVSLGAPFWFDLLQKVMNINVRGTGPKPDTA
jgi:hypothetical protein